MITVNFSSNKKFYEDNVFTLGVNDVFKFDHRDFDFETVNEFLKKYQPATITLFEIAYVPPGSELYSLHGPSTVVVTRKTEIPPATA